MKKSRTNFSVTDAAALMFRLQAEGMLWFVDRLVGLVFYGPSTHFMSFQARSVNLATLFLGKPPRQLTST